MKRTRGVLFALTVLGLGVPGTFAARAAPSGAPTAGQLTIEPGPGVTVSVDGRPYAGQLVLTGGADGVGVVNRVGFEQYVDGIGEVPSNWPEPALEAQAVAARTYALWTVLSHPPTAGGGQICASDDCQVYIGLAKTEGTDGSRWAAAVAATAGQVLQYQGRVIEALYGSADGGQTLSGGVPWLPSVPDPQDDLAPEHSWSWSAPLSSFATALGVAPGRTLTSLVSSSTEITETFTVANGSPSTVELAPAEFHAVVNRTMTAPAGMDLPLPSYRYSVSTYGTDVRIAGSGDGDGLGLSQYGALGKALQGWSAARILGDYYAGTVVAPLPAGEMPATIGVTLDSGATSVAVAANGPVRVVGPSGAVLATTADPAGWRATASPGGVTLAPDPQITFPAVTGLGSEAAPVPLRASPPAGTGDALSAGATPTTTVPPTTKATTLQAPTGPPVGAPGGARLAAAAGTGAPRRASASWTEAAAVAALSATVGLLVNRRKILLHRPLRPSGADTVGRTVQK